MNLDALTSSGGDANYSLGISAKREDCKPNYAVMAEKLKSRLDFSKRLTNAISDYVESGFFDYRRCSELKSFYGHLVFENREMDSELSRLLERAEKE